MLNIHSLASPSALRTHMPALLEGPGLGASVAGRRITADYMTCINGTRVPAFEKDVFPGVRAWSPPV